MNSSLVLKSALATLLLALLAGCGTLQGWAGANSQNRNPLSLSAGGLVSVPLGK